MVFSVRFVPLAIGTRPRCQLRALPFISFENKLLFQLNRGLGGSYSQYISVNKDINYGLDDWSSISDRGRYLFFVTTFRVNLGLAQSLIQWVPWISSWIRREKREANRLSVTNVEIGIHEPVSLLPNTSSCRLAAIGQLDLAMGNMFAWINLMNSW